jgi:mannose-1-phosphate guanylyltransferase
MLHAVIMAGGSGTRFWPLSRAKRPKQLLDLVGGRTMLQATVDRLAGLVPAERTWVITNRDLVPAVRAQLPELPPQQILGEPCKRDTAPAIGLAGVLLVRQDPQATMVVLPADHRIEPGEALRGAIRQAADLVERDPRRLVTFGIRPTYPAETFGYIERGEPLAGEGSQPGRAPAADADAMAQTGGGQAAAAPVYSVVRFREKPARSVAEEYLASGRFYWNSGIFVWNGQTILQALRAHAQDIWQRLEAIGRAAEDRDFSATLDREFTQIRPKSIDYAVMEHYQPVVVIEAPFTWDDVGSWQALARLIGPDADGNAVQGRHLGLETQGCIVRTSDDHLVVTLGVGDLIVVHTPDATLVADKQREEAIRKVVEALAQRGWQEYL